MIVKAITLHQPWASLVVHDYKRWETRSWSTSYRGWLAIHAAKRKPRVVEFHPYDVFHRRLKMIGCIDVPKVGDFNMPLGAVVGMAFLTHVGRTDFFVADANEDEIAFGDWSPGRFAWRLLWVTPFKVPVLASGRQGLWNWTVPPSREVQVQDIMQRRVR